MERDKKQLRKLLLHERMHMCNHKEQSLRLQRVMRTWLLGRTDIEIGAYSPIKKEFDPLPALYRWQEEAGDSSAAIAHKPLQPIQFVDSQPQTLENMLAPKRCIGLPVINKQTKTLQFSSWFPGCPMEEDMYGIPKPLGTPHIAPSLLFVPCVGYGPGGYRIGYGGGFYDRTLANLNPRPYTVGLAFSHAFVPDFFPEAHDIALDCILTEKGQAWP